MHNMINVFVYGFCTHFTTALKLFLFLFFSSRYVYFIFFFYTFLYFVFMDNAVFLCYSADEVLT